MFFINCGEDKYDPLDPNATSVIDNLNDSSASNNVDSNKATYLAENGVTNKAKENAIIGESYALNEITYIVVDSIMFIEKITNEEDIT